MNLIEKVKAFFTPSKADPVADAAHGAFSAASDAYDAAFHAIEGYITRANHRYAILTATRALYKTPIDSYAADDAADEYDETVAAYTDPEDFKAYTTPHLDAHTAAIENLAAAFDNLTDTFENLKPTSVYSSAAALYKSTCDTYKLAANAYCYAVDCAMTTALEGKLQAAKDNFEVFLLEMRATNPTETNPAAIKAKAAAFKTKVAEDAAKADALEEIAKRAEVRAEVYRAKAKDAKAKAEEALDSHSQIDD